MKFISFGSGSSGNCYYLFTKDEGLFIDVGIGVRTLKKHFFSYGLSLSRARHILITHDHADHVKSVGSMSSDYQLPVYSTELIHQGIVSNYCVSKKIPAALVRQFSAGETFQVGGFTVSTFPVPHDSRECVGYSIQADGVTFCIITDAGEITEQMEPYISSANYLVIESNYDEEMLSVGPYPEYLKRRISSGIGHLSNKACGEALAKSVTPSLRQVWLCHLSEENNHPELARKTVESVLRSYGIAPGTDFRLDVLRRKIPSEVTELL
jgi:phosphoribosyl 1,2-cyclic phosphodiesterase